MDFDNPADFELDLDRALEEFPKVLPRHWKLWLTRDMTSYLAKPSNDSEAELAQLMNDFDVIIDTKVFGEDMVWLPEFILAWMNVRIEQNDDKFYELFRTMRAKNEALYAGPISIILSHFHFIIKWNPGAKWIPYCELVGRLVGNSEQDRVAVEDLTAFLGVLLEAFDDDHNLHATKQQQHNNIGGNNDTDRRILQDGAVRCLKNADEPTMRMIASQDWRVNGYGGTQTQTIRAEHWERWASALLAIARDSLRDGEMRRDAFLAAEMLDFVDD